MAKRVFRITFGGVLAVALMACGQKDAEFEPTYYRDVQPILEARCNACHQAGDIGPFTFETYDDASRYADMIAAAVESKTMPPLPAEIEGCRDFVDERIMTAEERETLRMWAKQGAAPGDSVPGVSQNALTNFGPEDIGPPTSTHDMGVDYETSPDNPQASSLDEYRCFVVDPGWTEAKHLKAVGFVPDNRQVVHHGIIYLDLPNSHEDVDALEAADAAPGYNCFGGAGFDNAILLAGYAPGAKTKAFPDGATITLPRGSRFVVQLHYNFLNGTGIDRSSVAFWEVDQPSRLSPRGLILINRWFNVPAGVKEHTDYGFGTIIPYRQPALSPLEEQEGNLWGVSTHMHVLGSSSRVDLVRSDGTEECLLNVPKWDFNWQGSYRFREPVEAYAGDKVRISCTWDNSPEHQPIIEGVQQEPRDLTWGEGTTDEMCFGGATFVDFN